VRSPFFRRNLAPIVAGILAAALGIGAWAVIRRLRRAPAAAPARPTLAVLPFRNLSGNPAEDYVSDGMTEEMITQFGRMDPQGLGVIARTSVMKYKNTEEGTRAIGNELDVDYVLEGRVREDSKEAFVTAQLIQCATSQTLWSESYERPFTDFAARLAASRKPVSLIRITRWPTMASHEPLACRLSFHLTRRRRQAGQRSRRKSDCPRLFNS
jgi:TolB-like protein